MILNLSSEHVIESLRKQLRQWETLQGKGEETVSSGCDALDRILPQRGFHSGTLIEFLGEPASGATSLALMAAKQAGKEIIVVDREQMFYPLAWEGDAIFIHPRNQKDELWAIHQALGCQGVGAVLAWPTRLNGRVFRGLQLAAERGASLGVFVRSVKVRGLPTWADIQLLVEAVPGQGNRRVKVTLLRCRNGTSGASVELEFDDETQSVRGVAPQLAPAKIVRQPVA